MASRMVGGNEARNARRGPPAVTLPRRHKRPATAVSKGVDHIRGVHQVQRVYQRLRRAYGSRVWTPHRGPVDELVATILSQNTTDTNSHEAFRRLCAALPTWDQVLSAGTAQIAAPIRVGGLGQIKAARIKAVLREIRDRQQNLSLDFLRTMKPAEALEYLLRFKGIGRKTAACVLLFSFGMPVLPVDTHVHRVSKRLGLIGEGVDRDQAHTALAAVVPGRLVYPFHLLMIEHGRRVCHARNPECPRCGLLDLCPTGQKTVPGK
jgi:endonuclease-3